MFLIQSNDTFRCSHFLFGPSIKKCSFNLILIHFSYLAKSIINQMVRQGVSFSLVHQWYKEKDSNLRQHISMSKSNQQNRFRINNEPKSLTKKKKKFIMNIDNQFIFSRNQDKKYLQISIIYITLKFAKSNHSNHFSKLCSNYFQNYFQIIQIWSK